MEKVAPFKAGEDQIKEGSSIIFVKDRELAAALIAVGIPPRKDPGYTHVKRADGSEQWTFHFYHATEDGQITTYECIEGWKGDIAWIQANPMHPFAFAMAAIKNLNKLRDLAKQDIPFVAFRVAGSEGGTATLLVKEGGKKHQAAIKKGLKQV